MKSKHDDKYLKHVHNDGYENSLLLSRLCVMQPITAVMAFVQANNKTIERNKNVKERILKTF